MIAIDKFNLILIVGLIRKQKRASVMSESSSVVSWRFARSFGLFNRMGSICVQAANLMVLFLVQERCNSATTDSSNFRTPPGSPEQSRVSVSSLPIISNHIESLCD
jgi:hypothetical protein